MKDQQNPQVTLEEPTPDTQAPKVSKATRAAFIDTVVTTSVQANPESDSDHPHQPVPLNSKQRSRKTLLDPNLVAGSKGDAEDYFGAVPAKSTTMIRRKIWVKRPGASATLVTINEDDLVDDVRDMILRKYANSLGRTFDSPDVTLRIVPREHSLSRHAMGERTLGPEEPICRTIDSCYPGGQTVDEALLIDVPQRRTPRHSPRVYGAFPAEDFRPAENAADYFPAMPVSNSPHVPSNVSVTGSTGSGHHHSIAVINTGYIPPLPSPGGTRRMATHSHRPKFPRNNTSSPTILNSSSQSLGTSSIS